MASQGQHNKICCMGKSARGEELSTQMLKNEVLVLGCFINHVKQILSLAGAYYVQQCIVIHPTSK